MGSSPSKIKKKNRHSSQSLPKKSVTAVRQPRATSESSVIPPHIPSQHTNNNNSQQNQQNSRQYDLQQTQQKLLQQQQQRPVEESVNYSPLNNNDSQDLYQGQSHIKTTSNNNISSYSTDGNVSTRNSGGGSTAPPQGNTSQPRPSSNGIPSFNLMKGRKSNSYKQHRRQNMGSGSEYSKPLEISSPIIESKITMGAGNYSRDPTFSSISTEKPTPRRNNLPSHMNTYVEPPKPNSGAYKAPVPSIPVLTQPTSSSSLTTVSTADPSLPSSNSATHGVTYPPPPGSHATVSSSSHQDPYLLWKESLRNDANVTADSREVNHSRNNEAVLNSRPSRPNSYNSQTSRASSTFSITHIKKNKPTSGSTFATTLSPSPSNASQSSFRKRIHRDSKTNAIISDGSTDLSARANSNQVRTYLQPKTLSPSASENASTLSLPGSRYLGDDDSGGNDTHNNSSLHTGKHASEISLAGSPVNGSRVSSLNLTGTSSPNNRRDSQLSSPRHSAASSMYHKRFSAPLASPIDLSTLSATAGENPSSSIKKLSPALSARTANSSARESMSSISTANYRWMEEQDIESVAQDVINRDSVMMLFPSPTTSDHGSQGKFTPLASPSTAPTTATTSPTISVPSKLAGNEPVFTVEQMAQQSLEQQAQQHALLKYFFKGNYHAPLNKDELGSVLDVGCGAGLWMRDMALEFPLTEIHGVDAVVPVRKRRPRVPPSTTASTTTHNTGSHSTPPMSKHSSVQSTNDPIFNSGSTAKVPPAMLDSMPSNCFFHKADTTRGLPFPDNTFDFCRVRLVLWGYNLNSFPDLLSELIRVTKKGGWIEFIKTGLIHGNLDPDLVRSLPKFLQEYRDATLDAAIAEIHPERNRESQYRTGSLILPTEPYGLDHLMVSKVSLPFGPWGGKVGELWQQCFTAFLQELEPLIMDATLSGLVMDQYHRQFQREMQCRFDEAAAISEATENMTDDADPTKNERVTSFDQRLCTHLAWSNLINQLVKDATISSASLTNPATKATPYSHSNFLSSVKEVRSYNNFYIAYAQKVDIVELKQQYLLSRLEQDTPSPNLTMASMSTFPSLEAAAAYNRAVNNLQRHEGTATGTTVATTAAIKNNVSDNDLGQLTDQQSDANYLGNPLIQKISSPSLRQQYSASSESSSPKSASEAKMTGEMRDIQHLEEEGELGMMAPTKRKINRYGLVASLTPDDLEAFNFTTHDSMGSTSPKPASVATLSIGGGSRNPNHIDSVSEPAINFPSNPETILNTLASARANSQSPSIGFDSQREQEPKKSHDGFYNSPAAMTDNKEEGQQDYFNLTSARPQERNSSLYHQQQYHHHYNQQMNSVKHKNSPLSSPSHSDNFNPAGPDTGMTFADAVANQSLVHNEGDEKDVEDKTPQRQLGTPQEDLETKAERSMEVEVNEGQSSKDSQEEEGSEILISLHEDSLDSSEPAETEQGIVHSSDNISDNQGLDQSRIEPRIKSVRELESDVESVEGPLNYLTPIGDGDDSEASGQSEQPCEEKVTFVMPGSLA
ncbi:hypothetical protein FBU30_000253 [Linnemannia zychae]|nr:hypothetical protein FBU30_000253 [Linnemannia zychae]